MSTAPQGRAPWFVQLHDRLAVAVDQRVGWRRLPKPLALLTLVGLRDNLRRKNLFDTGSYPSRDLPEVGPPNVQNLTCRTADGTYNDLADPRMGMARSRFGRNVPPDRACPEPEPGLLSPSPREVSRALLTRHAFVPAESVNALVAAWLQFMVRDWVSHGQGTMDRPWHLDLSDDDPWPAPPMLIPRTIPDPTRPDGHDGLPPTFLNENSPWWDASQLYGNNLDEQRSLRTGQGGRLRVPDGPLFPDDPDKDPAAVPGFWVGLAMMHLVFLLEHNAICDALHDAYPTWSDEELFQRARLINAALLAKIHTVEWTPAVLSHPTTVTALHTNWYGLLGERLHRLLGRLGSGEVLSGIVGGRTDHFGVPYSLTEEFVAVYRMHPLIPDDWSFRSAADDSLLQEAGFRELTGWHAYDILGKHTLTDLLYSFGTSHPGLVTLHNYPRFLQEFQRPDGKLMDLGAVDILRSREVGVPRYNEFRRQFHLRPAKDFHTLTDNPVWAEELRRVYDGDIERVDLSVGLFAEPRPKGFAFSDTAFRVFVLMASRRLNSDRFLTRDYTPQVYTPTGLDWIENNTMTSVLLRHFPGLRASLRSVDNAFAPWTAAGGPR
ncbi:putative peroxidase [Streptomyces olivaceoviridis]|uniref:peroxidase family protein n=1 Tax=Streptomyces olivaceoviridis TaxID=1921 RepID=UPI0016721972|nr:peroxidase family protein [Streptomyces olivaceoviridis]GGY93255.1 putative peroxidase [Streptomyces olivaceoviridis]